MDERERFEAWARREHYNCTRCVNDAYLWVNTRDAWIVWQAAVADLERVTADLDRAEKVVAARGEGNNA